MQYHKYWFVFYAIKDPREFDININITRLVPIIQNQTKILNLKARSHNFDRSRNFVFHD